MLNRFLHSVDQRTLWLGCAFFLFLLAVVVTPWDYSLTQWLGNHPLVAFSQFMDRSLFEGNSFGGGDLGTMYMIAAALLYVLAWLPKTPNLLRQWRPELGFIAASSLVTTVYVVHGLKWTVGRARPYLVIWDNKFPFSNWFEPGPHNLLHGTFHGSFPSGHTATIMIFLTIAYVVAFHRRWGRYRLGCGIGALVISAAYLMAVSRCMHHSHFLTDCLVIIPLNWMIIHFLYFKGLNIPKQQELLAQHGCIEGVPTCWDVRLCLDGFFLVAGLMAFFIGLRGWFSGMPLPAFALIVAGLVFSLVFGRKIWRRHAHIFSSLARL